MMAEGTEQQFARLLEPLAENDQLTFKELQASYNFRNISERRRVFANLIVQELKQRPHPMVLDIGCGHGMARDNSWQRAIKPFTGEYWGIEPDPQVVPAVGLFDNVQNATMETAQLPAESIDLAYSWMVMEHVENPMAFCQQLFCALKPGGVYYFSTPNFKHYFTRLARIMRRMRVDELVLPLIHRREKLEEYHYPVQYRFNSEPVVRGVAAAAGFNQAEFAYVEAEGPIKYFPGPTKMLFHALAWKRTVWRRPDVLLTMIGRLSKSHHPTLDLDELSTNV